MKVVEKFVSINGEGTRAGELAVFIRFKGCNLACSYCDTMWANEKDCPFTEMSQEEILDYVKSTGVKNVTLTGGEPLLQEGVDRLIDLLLDSDLRVEIETNGAVDLRPFIKPVISDSGSHEALSSSDESAGNHSSKAKINRPAS
jgi:7-carboxy-7-deazaguanine synthase